MLDWLLHGTIAVGDGSLAVREVVGNGFGLASALLGMRRLVWAWPVGLVGNVLLFTVFVSGELSGATSEPLWGQAGRQVMFAVVGLYGWWRWSAARRDAGAVPVTPRWASARERLALLALAAVGYAAAYALLVRIGSWGPATEAWILAGSLVATYGMARGWVEFWLVWIAVDVVGVTTLVRAGYYPTAGMYLFYGAFCVLGLITWWRVERATHQPVAAPRPVDEGVPA
ncbi:nicotinamide mononucleotide transporter family protein [Nocardioides sp. Arc9.136]|uniref:nicotinamide mononucleotide transporter family protein n=1 Tax=Nocardioides sp. Arc9.136 TaxID=2996826 RepID=UPI0026663E5F|nr:nicotinamide mononucleotide transporter family protein [Nocardioides sp. Arc9.136]WKN46782.1 nicotinamide mononucleotide transporter family protein [Nocardioides sp. Arc9.136]